MSDSREEAEKLSMEALQLKLADYERWFHVLDEQIGVLELERKKLSAVTNHTDAGFMVIDASSRVVWVNEVFSRMFGAGCSPQEALGRKCHELLCRQEAPCGACPVAGLFETGAVAHHEIALESDGRRRHIYATAMPIKSVGGGTEQAMVMLQDISDLAVLRESQQALRQSETRKGAILEAALDGLVTIDHQGRIIEFNPSAERIFGYGKEQVLGRTITELIIPPAQRSRHIEGFKRFLETGEGPVIGRRIEITAMRADGSEFPVELAIICIPLEDGPIFSGYVRDLTDRKRLEEELRQAEKMSAVGLLVSGVAHELNNPLAGVMGFTQLLLAADLDEKVRRSLEKINREAERCKRIVQNLQTFARKHRAQKDYIGVNGVLESALELRSYHLKSDNIEVTTELEEGLPKTMADFYQLQQVFLNVIINAHQAMMAHARSGRLALKSRHEGEEIVVEIQDSGPGIPEENLGRIFDPFFTTKQIGQGTGLGLSICYGIIKEHKGRISVRNAPGGGAVFTITLPIRGRASEATGAESTGAEPKEASAGRRSILVVDDEISIIDVLYQMLRRDGHRVDTALNAATALRKIDKETYDLIICDLKMPGMSGQEMYETLRGSRADVAERVIFSTGDAACEEARTFLQRTGRKCLEKPFEIETVRSVVAAMLADAARQSA